MPTAKLTSGELQRITGGKIMVRALRLGARRHRVSLCVLAAVTAAATGLAVAPRHHTTTPPRLKAHLADAAVIPTTIVSNAGPPLPYVCADSNEAGSVYEDPCNGDQHQQWEWVNGTSNDGSPLNLPSLVKDMATGLCLTANNAGDVFTGGCGNYTNELWSTVWGDWGASIVNEATNTCLNVEGPGTPGDPDSLNATQCNSSDIQGWGMDGTG